MRRSKKGSLNLSINAIVVLILAITMLGLGLSFMRNIFGSATQEFEEVGGTVKKQMIDQMKESTRIVDISRPKIDIKAGEHSQVFIGFKNDGNEEREFRVKSSEGSTEPTSLGDDVNCLLLSTDENAGSGGKGDVYVKFKTSKTSVLKGEVVVLPINIKTTSNVDPDTCFYELQVDHGPDVDTDPSTITIELTVDISS